MLGKYETPTAENAIRDFALGYWTNENHDTLIERIYQAVKPLCKTQTDFDNGETSLYEWLEAGEYDLSVTVENLAADWDEMQSEAEEE